MAVKESDSAVARSYMVCLDDFERYAEKTLDSATLGYFQGGADDEVTLKDNAAAFRRYQILPRVLRNTSECNMETTILGHRIAFPMCIAPTAYYRMVHPDGEMAVARAAATVNTALTCSTFSTSSLEEVSEACAGGVCFLQLYVWRDHEATRRLVTRAESAGYSAIVLTVDAPVCGKRRAQCYNPSTLSTHLQLPNVETRMTQHLLAFSNPLIDPYITWDTVTWLKSVTNLPVVVKGILSAEDAVEAVRRGVSAIIVSNHGGRQLDSVPATLDVLSDVVQAVAGRCEVYFDGGIRTGTGVFKALALGAKAVFIGRPVVYGLAYDGEAGVLQVLTILRDEFRTTMTLAGCSTVDDINQSFVRRSTRLFVPGSRL